MKLFACCFCESEIQSQILSQCSGVKEPCQYNNNISSECSDFEEFRDTFIAFFSLFVKTKSPKGTKLISLLENDWSFLNTKLPGKRTFLNDVLKEIDTEFSCDTRVTYKEEITSCIVSWERIKVSLQERRRYFPEYNPDEEGWGHLLNCKIELAPGTYLYRARINPISRLHEPFPPEEMGAPVRDLASEGRANPKGFPFLYLCRDEVTTAYETRALLLDRITVGQFQTTKPLSIVDFCACFDPFIAESHKELADIAKQMLLFRAIANDMSRPIRRNSNNIEYVPTQYICEYIRHIINADGVQFKSSIHNAGCNIVLFNHLDSIKCTNVKLYEIKQTHIKWSSVRAKKS